MYLLCNLKIKRQIRMFLTEEHERQSFYKTKNMFEKLPRYTKYGAIPCLACLAPKPPSTSLI